jgi:hypothetical protein
MTSPTTPRARRTDETEMPERLAEYPTDPVAFIDDCLPLNELGRSWRLVPHQRAVLDAVANPGLLRLGPRLALGIQQRRYVIGHDQNAFGGQPAASRADFAPKSR